MIDGPKIERVQNAKQCIELTQLIGKQSHPRKFKHTSSVSIEDSIIAVGDSTLIHR